MNIFITGGTGFLGRNLVMALLNKKYNLFVLSRRSNTFLQSLTCENLSIIYGDISSINDLTFNQSIDVCIHFAWAGVNRFDVTDKLIQEKNVQWSIDVLNFSINHGCSYFINAGSRQEYSLTTDIITEETFCNPISEYGKGKLAFFNQAKKICVLNKIKFIHLRIFSVYGFGDHPWSLISSSIQGLLNNQEIKLGSCQQDWSFLYIKDFISAFILLLNSLLLMKEIETFNIASNDIRILKEFVHVIKENIESDGELLFGAFSPNKESTFPLIPSTLKFREITNWNEETTFEDGIKEMIRNFKIQNKEEYGKNRSNK
ncbi:MAG: NAD(P)-dependent oxidoreductase [Bacteroides sp.]|nr:NAD(P)-dependent oxidoreductase [Bacteroides sp.]